MRKGDILLISYKYDPVGFLIRKITKSKWNHVCIALDSNYIIDIRAKKIEIISKKRYLNEYLYNCKLLRINKLQQKEADIVLSYILSQKRKYSYITWLISGILILCGKKPIRPICSSLIANAFNKICVCFNRYKYLYQIIPEDINNSKEVTNVSTEL